MNSFTVWMLVAAAIAVALAMMAVVTGQRRLVDSSRHSLHGSVAKRMSLFRTLANPQTLSGERPVRRGLEVSNADYMKQRPPFSPNTHENMKAVLV